MMKSINGNETGNSGQSQQPHQHLLWDRPEIDPTNRLKTAMREAIETSGLSRMKVVADMNTLASLEGMTCGGRSQKVTEDILDKWCAAGSVDHVIPLRYLPAFCRVTGSILPLVALAIPAGGMVIVAEELKLLEWARLEIKRRRIGKDARRLAQEVGIE